MGNIWLWLFLGMSAAHLAASHKKDKRGRALTKPWLLLLLLLWYRKSAGEPDLWLSLALLFSWLGDCLLIPPGRGWFTAGGISFMLAHFCFIGAYAGSIAWSAPVLLPGLAAGLAYAAVSLLVIRELKESLPGVMRYTMYVYLIANSAMNVFALWRWRSLGGAGAAAACGGALLFFASDCFLFLVRYAPRRERIRGGHFLVMALYLAGVFGISLGTLLVERGI